MKLFKNLLFWGLLLFVGGLFAQWLRVLKIRKTLYTTQKVTLDKSYFPLNIFIDWVQGEKDVNVLAGQPPK